MSTICPYCRVPASACGSYALMKEPANWRGLLSGMTWIGPPDGSRLRVGGNSDWSWTRAASVDGRSVWDLIEYNFHTRDPREVNWYLYHFVGCRYSSDGRKNLNFHWANPGVIFTRKRPVRFGLGTLTLGPGYVAGHIL